MSSPSTPPPGSASDNRAPGYQAFVIVMTVMTVASISLRFWSRGLNVRANPNRGVRFWWDDWFALASVPFILAQFVLEYVEVHLGLGRHVWTLKEDDLANFLKILYIIYFLYDISIFLTKASALLFYSRVFPSYTNAAWFNHALRITHVINFMWLIGIIFGTVFMCDPVQKGWDPFRPGHCGTTKALFIGSAVPSVVIDLIILTLPIPKIWGLQMSRGRKIGVTVVFLLGYCVIVVSLGRLITILTAGSGLNTDITYLGIPVFLWVTAESPIILLSICLSAMLPLGRHLATHFFSPLATKISSLLSSRGGSGTSIRSKAGVFEATNDSDSQGIRLRSKSAVNEQFHSIDSERGMFPSQFKYTARVDGGEQQQQQQQRKDIPQQAIQVERKYDVDQIKP